MPFWGSWPWAWAASADDKDWGNLNRYAKQNQEVKKWPKEQRRVVFMGNSITENWASMRPEFFIKVILTTTLPAARFGWNPRITDAPPTRLKN